MLTESEALDVVGGALDACGDCAVSQSCAACPLFTDGNDRDCREYLLALARHPERFAMLGGKAVEHVGHRVLEG